MKLVADANVLFALLKPSSVANALVARHRLRLVSPEFALVELHRHRKEIFEKSGQKSFEEVVVSLKTKVVFVRVSEYAGLISGLKGTISDVGDLPYLALARRFNMPVWSNDAGLKGQELVDVFTTAELIVLLGA